MTRLDGPRDRGTSRPSPGGIIGESQPRPDSPPSCRNSFAACFRPAWSWRSCVPWSVSKHCCPGKSGTARVSHLSASANSPAGASVPAAPWPSLAIAASRFDGEPTASPNGRMGSWAALRIPTAIAPRRRLPLASSAPSASTQSELAWSAASGLRSACHRRSTGSNHSLRRFGRPLPRSSSAPRKPSTNVYVGPAAGGSSSTTSRSSSRSRKWPRMAPSLPNCCAGTDAVTAQSERSPEHFELMESS